MQLCNFGKKLLVATTYWNMNIKTCMQFSYKSQCFVPSIVYYCCLLVWRLQLLMFMMKKNSLLIMLLSLLHPFLLFLPTIASLFLFFHVIDLQVTPHQVANQLINSSLIPLGLISLLLNFNKLVKMIASEQKLELIISYYYFITTQESKDHVPTLI